MSRIWQSALATLEHRINPSYYDLWIRPIQCMEISDDEIRLRAPNSYFQEWFSTHYLPIVLEELRQQTSRQYRVTFEIATPQADQGDSSEHLPAEQRTTVSPSTPLVSPNPNDEAIGAARRSSRTELIQHPQQPSSSDLLPSFTFDTFVVGPSNQLAHAAARAASEHPADKFNPVYIYGGVGLGKTHLLMAIGHELRRRNPGWNVVYVSCERYINDYIAALRAPDGKGESRIDEFRRHYREDCDALLIDDIQFLAGKERTQDEFFHTFNALWHAHKQIVLTSDKFPYEIDNLEERLRSRFGWGLVADIQRPDFETRVAILARKAEIDGISLPEEVAHHLAHTIRTNVRELEGALVRLAAYASIRKAPITVDLCHEALTDLLDPSRTSLTIDSIAHEVAEHFHVKVADLKGPRRHQSVAWPRQVAMYLSYQLLQGPSRHVSYPQVASYFGGRDHTTVLAACRKVERLRERDTSVASLLATLEQKLRR